VFVAESSLVILQVVGVQGTKGRLVRAALLRDMGTPLPPHFERQVTPTQLGAVFWDGWDFENDAALLALVAHRPAAVLPLILCAAGASWAKLMAWLQVVFMA